MSLDIPPNRNKPQACGDAMEVLPFQVDLINTPNTQKSTGGLPKLEKEAQLSPTDMVEMV
jgi:hypothetical protein